LLNLCFFHSLHNFSSHDKDSYAGDGGLRGPAPLFRTLQSRDRHLGI
jgi:hypothetical protein